MLPSLMVIFNVTSPSRCHTGHVMDAGSVPRGRPLVWQRGTSLSRDVSWDVQSTPPGVGKGPARRGSELGQQGYRISRIQLNIKCEFSHKKKVQKQ